MLLALEYRNTGFSVTAVARGTGQGREGHSHCALQPSLCPSLGPNSVPLNAAPAPAPSAVCPCGSGSSWPHSPWNPTGFVLPRLHSAVSSSAGSMQCR